MEPLQFSPTLNRPIRQDPAVQLGEPTRPFLESAVREGRVDGAEAWLTYYLNEASTIHVIFGVWNWHLVRYYLERKGEDAWASLLEASIAPWLGTTIGATGRMPASVEVDGRSATLRIPGWAQPFILVEGDERYVLQEGEQASADDWRTAASDAIRAGDFDALRALLDAKVTELRRIHDISCDWTWALLTVIGREWGEEHLGDVMRITQAPWVTPRYAALRDMSIDQILQLTVEGMRGHFSGENRAGTITVTEAPDHFVLGFDACGTGGRMRRGDPLVGSGSRTEPPYNFLNVRGAYDWTWNRDGVCAYCAHCAIVNQILPIEGLGHPMRMTLYPERADDPCRWVIYKDRHNFPPEAFTAVGKSDGRPQP